jgi:hypothetical protein
MVNLREMAICCIQGTLKSSNRFRGRVRSYIEVKNEFSVEALGWHRFGSILRTLQLLHPQPLTIFNLLPDEPKIDEALEFSQRNSGG